MERNSRTSSPIEWSSKSLSSLQIEPRRAMVRSKATGEYVPNLIFKNLFLHMDHPKVKGGVTSPAMWEVHLHQERAFSDIEHLLLVQRQAMARWKADSK